MRTSKRTLKTEREEVLASVHSLPWEAAKDLYKVLGDHPSLRFTWDLALIYRELKKKVLMPDDDDHSRYVKKEREDRKRSGGVDEWCHM